MTINIVPCETSKCDPEVLVKERNGVTSYGLRMRFCECEGVQEHAVTFWAKSLADLHVFTIVMQEKVESHMKGTPSEAMAHV